MLIGEQFNYSTAKAILNFMIMIKIRLLFFVAGAFIASLSHVNGLEISNPDFRLLLGIQDSIPKGVITIDYFQDNEYYVFHRADGSIVKKVRYDSFPDYSAFADLGFEKDTTETTLKYLLSNSTLQEKKQELSAWGITLPDSLLDGCNTIEHFRPNILKPCSDYEVLNYILSVSSTIMYVYKNYDLSILGQSRLYLYNTQGEIVFERQVDYEICNSFCISSDGRFLICDLRRSPDFESGMTMPTLGIYDLKYNNEFNIDIPENTLIGYEFIDFPSLIRQNNNYFDWFFTSSGKENGKRYFTHIHISPVERYLFTKLVELPEDGPYDIDQVKRVFPSLFYAQNHKQIITNADYTRSNY